MSLPCDLARTAWSSRIWYTSGRSLGRKCGQCHRWNKCGGWYGGRCIPTTLTSYRDHHPEGLVRVMTDIVERFGAFGVREWEKETETLLTRVPVKHPTKGAAPQPPPAPLVLAAAGHKYAQTADDCVRENDKFIQDINQRRRAAWSCIRKRSPGRFSTDGRTGK